MKGALFEIIIALMKQGEKSVIMSWHLIICPSTKNSFLLLKHTNYCVNGRAMLCACICKCVCVYIYKFSSHFLKSSQKFVKSHATNTRKHFDWLLPQLIAKKFYYIKSWERRGADYQNPFFISLHMCVQVFTVPTGTRHLTHQFQSRFHWHLIWTCVTIYVF